MKNKYLAFSLLCMLTLSVSVKAEYDFSAPYVDKRFGKTHSAKDELKKARPEAQKIFYLSETLFNTYIEKDEGTVKKLYERVNGDVKPPKELFKLPLDLIQYTDLSATSLLTYLFKEHAPSGINFDTPIVVGLDDRDNNGYDEHYTEDNGCLGMGYLEAELKQKCHHKKRINFGLIELNYSKSLNSLQAQEKILQVPDNKNVEAYSYKLFSTYPRVLGFYSNVDKKGFKFPQSTFDNNLYSPRLSKFISSDTSFADFGADCSLGTSDNCKIFFLGKHTSQLFGGKFYNRDNYTFNMDRALKIKFSDSLKPYVDLRNTILSDSGFVNYGFYTEAEMLMLKDLGYEINSREFFGKSIYTNGTKDHLINYELKDGFYSWSETKNFYDSNHVSRVPLGIGTHIYGSYNNVVQQSTIASIGYGAVGVRVDGSSNVYTLPVNEAIFENGYNAIGIAVTYGKDNIINIDGSVQADFDEGIGVSLDFGSNVRSDFEEYRGSYSRVRTRDVFEGRLRKNTGSSFEVPEEIKGPLVSQLNISGTVSGNKYAIYIDGTAHVRQINFIDRAKINGSIHSDWAPYIVDNRIYENNSNLSVIPAKLSFVPEIDSKRASDILPTLRTNLNFGVSRTNDSDDHYMTILHFFPNKKSNITVNGNIVGKSFNLSSFGGRTHFNGFINVHRLYVANSVVHLKTEENKFNYVSEFALQNGGQLNLTNGLKERFYVGDNALISSNSVISLDTDRNAKILDTIVFGGKLKAPDGVVNLEPGLSYNDIKTLSSDPKAFLSYLNQFVQNGNALLSQYGVTTKFPKHIWYAQGDLGRKIRCSVRGCYVQEFVNSYARASEPLPYWRYVLSIIGCIILVLGTILSPRLAKFIRFS